MKQRKNVGGSRRLPRYCSINFEFSLDRMECKICRYFDACLSIFTKAHKLARNI